MRRNYFNEHWIDMPAHYKPKETDMCDGGAYWKLGRPRQYRFAFRGRLSAGDGKEKQR
jgi:hypothetical protein